MNLGLIIILTAVIFEVAADLLFKKWSLGSQDYFLAFGLLLYFIGTVFWAYSLKYENLAKAIPVFTILNLIFVIIAGLVIFKEDISDINKAGIVLGLISVLLLEL